ncbi:MAG: hypothetical protein OXD49_00980 [Candidatus Poribacteria bacterium]|nr:hypothetical protein [Candidatus Poribacteria bacterium]
MQGQTIITTHDVDELFIFRVIRLIQRRAFPNLRNIIAKTHLADISEFVEETDPLVVVSILHTVPAVICLEKNGIGQWKPQNRRLKESLLTKRWKPALGR